MKNILCFFGIHDWKYTIIKKYGSNLEEYYYTNERICLRCNVKEIKVGYNYFTKWIKIKS